jgi:hypothetical protein
MSRCIEVHNVVGQRSFYICGIPGHYSVKACGNNRIVKRGLPTINAARFWIRVCRSPVISVDQ